MISVYRCLQIHESLAPVSLLPVVIPGLHLVAFGVFAVCSDDLVVLGWVSYDNSGNVRDVFFENWSKHLCSLSVSLFTLIRLFYIYKSTQRFLGSLLKAFFMQQFLYFPWRNLAVNNWSILYIHGLSTRATWDMSDLRTKLLPETIRPGKTV